MRHNNLSMSVLGAALCGFAGAASGQAPMGSAFTYQGQLKQGGAPVPDATCDVEFSLWDDPLSTDSSHYLGADLQLVEVTNGLFTARLNDGTPPEFGEDAFNGDARWLEIAVRCPAGFGAYTTLDERQELTPAPYALHAAGGSGGVGSVWEINGGGDVHYSDGNVGIGTVLPSSPLDVSGAVSTGSVATVTNNIASGISGSALTVINSGRRSIPNSGMIVNNLVTKVGGSNSTKTGLEVNSTGSWAPGTPNQPNVGLHVTVSGADRNFSAIFEGGSVGIGTDNPGDPLHVVDTAQNADVRIESTDAGGSARARLWMKTPERLWSLENDGNLNLFKIRDQTAGRDRVVVAYDGDVGIGTTSPTERLHVNGNIRVKNDADIFGLDQIKGYNDLRFYGDESGGPDLHITRSGSVGIGTTAPGAKLHVAGGNVLLDNNRGIRFKDSSGTARTALSMTSANDIRIRNDAGGAFDFTVPNPFPGGGTINLMHISPVLEPGGVGIGTTSPSNALSVAGSADFSGGVGIGTSTPRSPLSFPNALGDKIRLWGEADAHYGLGIQSRLLQIHADTAGSDIAFGYGSSRSSSSFTEAMRVRGNGRVGIGTTSPGASLDVKRNSYVNLPQLKLTESEADFARLTLANTENSEYWTIAGRTRAGAGGFNDDELNFYHSFEGNMMTIRMRQGISGVGIGRKPTGNRLEVQGNASKTTAGSWWANSDRRVKKNIKTVDGALGTLDKVRLVSFEYTDAYRAERSSIGDHRYVNVIAQEFQQVFPEHVKPSGEKLPNGEEILQVDTYPLTIYSAAAIQELHEIVEEKSQVISDLETRVSVLEELVSSRRAEASVLIGNFGLEGLAVSALLALVALAMRFSAKRGGAL